MALAPFGFDPFFGLGFGGLDTAIDRAFDRTFQPAPRRRGRRGEGQQEGAGDVGTLALTFPGLASTLTTAGTYPMDVIELPDTYVIRADAPGFDPSDINIEVHDGVITLSAEHEEQRADRDKEGRALRRERVYRSFRRSFTLPDDAKEDEIEAHMDKGVLSVRIKKEEQPQRPEPKRITVRGAGVPAGEQQGRIAGGAEAGGAGAGTTGRSSDVPVTVGGAGTTGGTA